MNFIIATSRSWNEVLAERLTETTGHKFHLITQKEDLTVEYIEKINPKYVFFPHWSYIIPEEIHTRFGCVIFHMTDLPYGRGGSPLQNLIQRGHHETKISALRCTSELDAGPIYLKQSLCLEGSASEIFLRAIGIIEEMIKVIVKLNPTPQPQSGNVTTFKRRAPTESNLVEASIHTLNDFFDFIRMLDAEGYPRAFIEVHNHKIEFSRVQIEHNKLVGTFVVYKQNFIPNNDGGGVKQLIDDCYPKPPQDVYSKMLNLYKAGDPVYTLEHNDKVIGLVYCSIHSKGGHLESLAVSPAYRGLGLATRLVEALMQDNKGVISLTTRIPNYFEKLGFLKVQELYDQSVFMIYISL